MKESGLSKQLFSGVAHSTDNMAGMMIKLPQGKQQLGNEEEEKNKSLIEWLRQHPTYTMDVSNLAPVSTSSLSLQAVLSLRSPAATCKGTSCARGPHLLGEHRGWWEPHTW